MDKMDAAREALLEKLEEIDWDLSLDMLDEVAEGIKQFFPSVDQAREFVESHASYLYDLMEDTGSTDSG